MPDKLRDVALMGLAFGGGFGHAAFMAYAVANTGQVLSNIDSPMDPIAQLRNDVSISVASYIKNNTDASDESIAAHIKVEISDFATKLLALQKKNKAKPSILRKVEFSAKLAEKEAMRLQRKERATKIKTDREAKAKAARAEKERRALIAAKEKKIAIAAKKKRDEAEKAAKKEREERMRIEAERKEREAAALAEAELERKLEKERELHAKKREKIEAEKKLIREKELNAYREAHRRERIIKRDSHSEHKEQEVAELAWDGLMTKSDGSSLRIGDTDSRCSDCDRSLKEDSFALDGKEGNPIEEDECDDKEGNPFEGDGCDDREGNPFEEDGCDDKEGNPFEEDRYNDIEESTDNEDHDEDQGPFSSVPLTGMYQKQPSLDSETGNFHLDEDLEIIRQPSLESQHSTC
eukprot:UC4_evm2s59